MSELTREQRRRAREYFTGHQLAPPYDYELDALAMILQYAQAPIPAQEAAQPQTAAERTFTPEHVELIKKAILGEMYSHMSMQELAERVCKRLATPPQDERGCWTNPTRKDRRDERSNRREGRDATLTTQSNLLGRIRKGALVFLIALITITLCRAMQNATNPMSQSQMIRFHFSRAA
jgi:hypothetical protein